MPLNNCIRIVLVDDHLVFLEALDALISASPDVEVVATSSFGTRAVALILEHAPDVAIIDISMPDVNGLAVAERLILQGSPTRVIFLTAHDDSSLVKKAIQLGAQGFILKKSAFGIVLQAIRSVASGGFYIDPVIAGALISGSVPARGLLRGGPGTASDADLTARESEVLKLVAQGHTLKEIAARLGITIKSADTYKTRAKQKLQLSTRAKIVHYAVIHGWLKESPI